MTASIVDEARFNLPSEHIFPYLAKLINFTRYDRSRVFPRPFTHWGVCPPPQVQGDKVLIGGTHEGDLTLIDYIIN